METKAQETYCVGVLQAVLGGHRRSRDTKSNEVLAEVVETLGKGRGALLARLGVLVAGPCQLTERGGTRPHLAADDGVVDLLGPERCRSADNVLALGLGLVAVKVVVVDALPRLVGGAPGAADAAVVEGRRRAGGIGVALDIVAGIVANVATEAAVEVQEVGRRDNDIEASSGQLGDVVNAVVPRLHDDLARDVCRVSISRQKDILPHNQAAVGAAGVARRGEDGHGVVEPVLVEIKVGAGRVLSKPLADGLGEVETASLQLVATNVEEVVGKLAGDLAVNLFHGFVHLRVL